MRQHIHRIRPRLRLTVGAIAIAALAVLGLSVHTAIGEQSSTAGNPPSAPLKAPADFASIRNRAKRSAAIFSEVGKVLTHQRCTNCHPSVNSPMQGEFGMMHEPPVSRGKDGFGTVGMRCQACHSTKNFDSAKIPGAENWHLAPSSMAWQGKSVAEICAQIKDPARNGERDLAAIVDHVSKDHLVTWSWNPGPGREPPPGSQAELAALMQAWVDTGAVCPKK